MYFYIRLATMVGLLCVLFTLHERHDCLNHRRIKMTTHLLSIKHADWPKLHDMCKARDANAWQRTFSVDLPLKFLHWICYSSLFRMMLLHVLKADVWLKQIMPCSSADSFDFVLKITALALKGSCIFPRKIEPINRTTRHVNHKHQSSGPLKG